MERLENSHIIGGEVNGAAALENDLAFPQKVKDRVAIGLGNCTPRYIPNINENKTTVHKCSQQHCSLFIITKRKKKQPKCPPLDEWINKRCYIHTIEYY